MNLCYIFLEESSNSNGTPSSQNANADSSEAKTSSVIANRSCEAIDKLEALRSVLLASCC